MAAWDGEFTFTLDNHSLLRAIQAVEGDTTVSGVIYTHVVNKPGFAVVKDNDYLRGLLKDYLIAEITYADEYKKAQERGKVWGVFHRSEKKTLKAQLESLKGDRDEKFKAFEMLRRLTDWDNPLLKRIPFSGE